MNAESDRKVKSPILTVIVIVAIICFIVCAVVPFIVSLSKSPPLPENEYPATGSQVRSDEVIITNIVKVFFYDLSKHCCVISIGKDKRLILHDLSLPEKEIMFYADVDPDRAMWALRKGKSGDVNCSAAVHLHGPEDLIPAPRLFRQNRPE